MAMPQDDQAVTQVFVSYAHDDDAVLDFVEKFANDLKYYAFADHGREIKVFVDNQSIIWGEEWRAKIYDSVKGASAFVPLVTMRYLASPMCREELQLFVESAQNLGVKELFLPIVVLGHKMITEDSDNLATRHVASRQYIKLKDAVLDGTTSSTWRKALVEIASRLVDGIERAEEHLTQGAEQLADESTPTRAGNPDTRPDDAPGLLEVYEIAVENVNRFGPLLASFSAILVEFKEKVDKLQKRAPKAGGNIDQQALLRFANNFSPRAVEAESLANELERSATQADQSIREVHRMLSQYGSDQQKEEFSADVNGAVEAMALIAEAQRGADEALKQSKSIEILNVPVRAALKPLRNGLNSTSAALRTMLSWRELADFT
ncbi:toll/interleukin-1 receptor domain-containing protein [Amycolatopsis oliviviridis]|uniref:TIR domain-containing protein n=2 Tax=Amycolatopsis oliviviridis TaxID=1471590 RepID=A0ABQ3LW35_9PSEU|nr:hypothetical protein GCM10017790_51600 [Amycolatopsis oliviviridis]